MSTDEPGVGANPAESPEVPSADGSVWTRTDSDEHAADVTAEASDTARPSDDDEIADAAVEPVEQKPAPATDEVLLASVDLARAALLDITPAMTIGPPAGSIAEEDHVLSLMFESRLAGYPGWHWTVTLARVDENTEPTVLEVELLPGEHALIAPDWVPWSERLAEYTLAQELAAATAADADDDDELDDDDDDDDDDEQDLDDGIDLDIDDHVTDDDELDDDESDDDDDSDDDDYADDDESDDDDDDDDDDNESDDDGDFDDDPHAEGSSSGR